jgi:hypothetical protein
MIRGLRVIAGCALVGAVTAGALFGWAPAYGVFTVQGIGAAIGLGLGIVANAKHLV